MRLGGVKGVGAETGASVGTSAGATMGASVGGFVKPPLPLSIGELVTACRSVSTTKGEPEGARDAASAP